MVITGTATCVRTVKVKEDALDHISETVETQVDLGAFTVTENDNHTVEGKTVTVCCGRKPNVWVGSSLTLSVRYDSATKTYRQDA